MSIEVTRRRWNLPGHILRLHKKKTARKTMKFMSAKSSNKKFRVRKRATIYTTVNRDIKKTKEKNRSFSIREIKSEIDLCNIAKQGRNKKHWNVFVKQVVQAAYSNTSIRQHQQKAVNDVHNNVHRKKCPCSELFWSVFPRIWTEYRPG